MSSTPCARITPRLSDSSHPGRGDAGAPIRRAFARSGSLLLVGALAACSPRPEAGTPVAVPPPRAIQTAAVAVSTRATVEEVVGTVRARRSTTVASTLTATVGQVRVHIGSHVRTGDVLLRLSAHEVEAKLNQARAVYAQAKLEDDRAQALATARAIPTAQVDAARSQLTVAEASAAEAETMLGYTVLRAPFDGVITAKSVDVGDTAVPGQALLVVEQPDRLRFEVAVPEASVATLTTGRRLEIRFDALDRSVVGTVAELSPTADSSSRTLTVKLDLPSTAGLHAGQFGRLRVPTAEAPALAVPASALVRHGQLEELFVVQRDRAWLRLVKTGRSGDGLVEVLSGVGAGERVATSDLAQLVDGQSVRSLQ